MRLRNSLIQQGIFVIVFPLLCQIVVVLLLAGQVSQIRDQQLQATHARDMISTAYTILLDSITGIFEAYAGGEQEGLASMEDTNKQLDLIGREVAILRDKAGGNPVEARHVLAVDTATRGLIEVMKWVSQQQALGIHNWKRVNDKCYEAGKEGSKNLIDSLQALVDAEKPLANQDALQANQLGVQMLFVIALVNFALALGLGYFYVSRIVGALKAVDKNRQLLAERKPLLPVVAAHDEIIELDLAMQSAQASLSQALEAGTRMIADAGNLICSLDNDLLFIEANPAATKILGVEPADLVGRSVREFIDSAAVEQLREAQSKRQERKFEFQLAQSDGALIHTHWSVNPAEASYVLFCVIQDISEQKRREGMRQRFLDAVQASLRTPIASIVESLEQVIASGAINQNDENVQSVKNVQSVPSVQDLQSVQNVQSIRADLKRAKKSARQCILLIDVLLDAQSAETGIIKIEPKSVSIGQVVDDSVELVKNIADKKGVEIECRLLQETVVCDPFKLTQTTVNFLSNAIKFSPPGGKIFVAMEETADFVEVSITDQGPGISEEYREKIFKPFVQVPGEKAKEGTGLGLAICKQIIDAHSGEIGVRPAAHGNSGSTFWYRMPKPKVRNL
jgi:PAS domain S-box-containing protein